jgi:hypothetical protein
VSAEEWSHHDLEADDLVGVIPVAEAVRHLRGEAGAAQVPDAKIALAVGSGGWLSCIGAVVLGRE